MKWFYIIFQLLVISLLVWNFLLVIFFYENIIDLSRNIKYSIITFTVLLNFYIINKLVKIIFYDPIKNLEITIKKFIIWKYKDDKIEFKKIFNSDFNYILTFFEKTLNTLKNIKDEFIHGKEIKSEVELWKEIQWTMLEKKILKIPSLDIIMKSKPSWEIGWDSYDIIKQDENYYIYVWDATGHWVGAWFVMIMVNALISWFAKIFKSGATILIKTNDILKPRVKANLLMSLLLVRWDETEKKIYMTWAWHEYLMIYKYKENKTYKIKSGWVALWMIKDISKLIKERWVNFEKNDVIVLYSDWITEAINKPKKDWTEEMFWEQRLMDSITNAPNNESWKYKSASNIFNNITIDLSKFMWYKFTQLDDVTLGVLHYKWCDKNDKKNEHKEIGNDFITEWSWYK